MTSQSTRRDFRALLKPGAAVVLPGVSNALFLQASRGHARIDGQFEAIDGTSAGKKVMRIADAINWQSGRFGGQAVLRCGC